MEALLRENDRAVGITFRTYYFSFFFGMGALFPLLGVYLQEHVHLTGVQIGNIMSIGPVMMIFAQPLWGVVCDYTQKPRHILFFTLLLTSAIGVVYSMTNEYYFLLLIALLLAFGQSAVIPVSDSITLSYVQRKGGNYGSIRLYGALGFAAAVLVAGKASDYAGAHIIFYIFTLSVAVAAVLTWFLPKEPASLRVNLRAGSSVLLKNRQFKLFLLCVFLIFGPIFANNTYFGLFITNVGGTLTGVGLAFLFAAGSEAPFMRVSSYFIRKIGIANVMIAAAFVSGCRWLFYFFEPSLFLVYVTTISQGISVGLFIPAALQYVRDLSPPSMRSTAVALYASAGGGLGALFCNFAGGILMDMFGIHIVYLSYAILTFSGVLLFMIQVYVRKGKLHNVSEESA